jgi:ADP-ribose pyrophosphatase YjhB (NUDIX family)
MQDFELIARGVILHKGKILVCKAVGHANYFLPGGHIDFGEGAEQALKRELLEELGVEVKTLKYIGSVENIYRANSKKHHELNLLFFVTLKTQIFTSLEDHITFELVTTKEFLSKPVLPKALQKSVLKWLKTRQSFWASQKD